MEQCMCSEVSWLSDKGETKMKKNKCGRNEKEDSMLEERRSKGKRKAEQDRNVLNGDGKLK